MRKGSEEEGSGTGLGDDEGIFFPTMLSHPLLHYSVNVTIYGENCVVGRKSNT